MPETETPRYERIGLGYARTRREDPDQAARIQAALGDARTVVNIGAGALPLRDRSVDAAMAILTIHHWDDERERGRAGAATGRARRGRDRHVRPRGQRSDVADGRLPARGRPPGRRDLPAHRPDRAVAGRHDDGRDDQPPRDTPDWTLASFWAHPERVLDPDARQATSGFARMEPAVVQRVVAAVADDLHTGAWDERHGHLRERDSYDVGLRLIVNRLN